MLDYAANGSRYWPAALLQQTFEATCNADGLPVDEAYAPLLRDRTPRQFWAEVEERLNAGRMRLLFVADRIPLELRAVVEFLNRQLRQTDVYAVELAQYRGEGSVRVLVPRVHGEVAFSGKAPLSADRRASWPCEEVERAADAYGSGDRETARALLGHAAQYGRWRGGTGQLPSAIVSYPIDGAQRPVWALTLDPDPTRARLAFSVGSLAQSLGTERAAAFAGELAQIPEFKARLADAAEKNYNVWRHVTLAELRDRAVLDIVIAAIDNLMASRSQAD